MFFFDSVMVIYSLNNKLMKKLFLPAAAGLVLGCFSCNSDKTSSGNALAEKNLAAAHGISKAIETGDMSKLGDYIATDCVDHAGSGNGEVKGLDSIKASLTNMHNMAKDMKSEVIKDLADSEFVFEWMRFTGISDGTMGMPKGPYKMTAIEANKYKDGKVIEHWTFMEPAEMMKMMAPSTMESPK